MHNTLIPRLRFRPTSHTRKQWNEYRRGNLKFRTNQKLMLCRPTQTYITCYSTVYVTVFFYLLISLFYFLASFFLSLLSPSHHYKNGSIFVHFVIFLKAGVNSSKFVANSVSYLCQIAECKCQNCHIWTGNFKQLGSRFPSLFHFSGHIHNNLILRGQRTVDVLTFQVDLTLSAPQNFIHCVLCNSEDF
jgi:hypothetical protein